MDILCENMWVFVS